MNTDPSGVVGIGASAGGLKALESLFNAMPVDTGMAFVVIQHLSPDFKSLMDDILQRHTSMKITSAKQGQVIEANHIYLNPPKTELQIQNGRFNLFDHHGKDNFFIPINAFFTSLAEAYGEHAIGIVLSGTGSDGAGGVVAIRKANGFVLAQSFESAEFDGMPRSAVQTNAVDAVTTPSEMPALIANYLENGRDNPETNLIEAEGNYAKVFELLEKKRGIKFEQYKIGTVSRRIGRRMAFLNFQQIEDYEQFCEGNPEEVDALYCDLLIGVTEFYRDPAVFDYLRQEVIPHLVDAADSEIRVWSAGCATGEEAITLAMLFHEAIEKADKDCNLTVFATDVHHESLSHASSGLYLASQMDNLPDALREKYMQRQEDGHMRILPSLRQCVVFAEHNLIKDPPFTRLDMVSCRNLLIYFKPKAQAHALGLVHYALHEGGVLVLGTSEGLGTLAANFQVLSSKHRIYRSVAGNKIHPSHMVQQTREQSTPTGIMPQTARKDPGPSRALLASYDVTLERFAPPGVILDANQRPLHLFGGIEKYLLRYSGRPDADFLSHFDDALKLAVSTSIQRSLKQERPIVSKAVSFHSANRDGRVDIRVEPVTLDDPVETCYLVTFSDHDEPSTETDTNETPVILQPSEVSRDRIRGLEQELQTTRENLQATVEELQSSNEELQAGNEEILASNEELQSTNEELNSVNEELYSVNSEFERKNHELNELNRDHINLLQNLDSGIVYINSRKQIRKFNPAIANIFNLLPQDVGRPLEHIAYNLDNHKQLFRAIDSVLNGGTPQEDKVNSRDGIPLLQRVIPFRDHQGQLDGAVIVYTEISQLVSLQYRLDMAMRASRFIWWEWDIKSDNLPIHSAEWCILGYDCNVLANTGTDWLEMVHPDDKEAVNQSLMDCLEGKRDIWEAEHRFRDKKDEWRWVQNHGQVVQRDKDNKPIKMVGTTQDIHARKKAEIALKDSESLLRKLKDRYEVALAAAAAGVWEWDTQTDELYLDVSSKELLGLQNESRTLYFSDWLGRVDERNRDSIAARLRSASRNLEPFELRCRIDYTGNSFKYVRLIGKFYQEEHTTLAVAVLFDTSTEIAEQKVRSELQQQLIAQQKFELLGNLAGGIAHDFNNILAIINGYAEAINRESSGTDSNSEHDSEKIQKACMRGKDLIDRLLKFSRSENQEDEKVDLVSTSSEAIKLAESSVPKNIEVTFNSSEEIFWINASSVLINQIVINLISNAVQAIGDDRGLIAVTIDKANLNKKDCKKYGLSERVDYLTLTVRDNGPGIPEDMLLRIFEPFYTTKPVGLGTGLGLSVIQGIVSSHGGHVAAYNHADGGAVLRIYWPLFSDNQEDTSIIDDQIKSPGNEIEFNTKQIVVIDDESEVAKLMHAYLSEYGFSVASFTDSRKALEHLAYFYESTEFIVTDQMMPGVTGLELIAKARRLGCHAPALLLSGFGFNMPEIDQTKLQPLIVRQKPVSMEELITMMGK